MSFSKWFWAMCFAPAIASIAIAEDYNYVGDNHSWSLTCNNSGFVLRSQYPVSRFHSAGAASSVTSEKEILYLGNSCDASHTVLGDGKWCWANGGFSAEFEHFRIGFPRQEILCQQASIAASDCRC
ncbi:hypothetical protein J7444_07550 [Labrenzia sp. R4_1]|uniref:hypothetical protein n=1 Tax=Labrenzia sp. R4_1 TaxID=2821106 RepID=UPI001ADBC83A|nr:hypothetical protein [Labrenzia sp. R4_1]MBO9424569.1 hypothetical protein [Labrenzia sp. R4_1]